jgi:hypothetical protein
MKGGGNTESGTILFIVSVQNAKYSVRNSKNPGSAIDSKMGMRNCCMRMQY